MRLHSQMAGGVVANRWNDDWRPVCCSTVHTTAHTVVQECATIHLHAMSLMCESIWAHQNHSLSCTIPYKQHHRKGRTSLGAELACVLQ